MRIQVDFFMNNIIWILFHNSQQIDNFLTVGYLLRIF